MGCVDIIIILRGDSLQVFLIERTKAIYALLVNTIAQVVFIVLHVTSLAIVYAADYAPLFKLCAIQAMKSLMSFSYYVVKGSKLT